MYTILAPNTTCPGFSPTWRHCRSPGPAPAAVCTYILFNSKHRPKSAHIRFDVSTWRLQLWRRWYLTRTDNSTEIPYVSCLFDVKTFGYIGCAWSGKFEVQEGQWAGVGDCTGDGRYLASSINTIQEDTLLLCQYEVPVQRHEIEGEFLPSGKSL